jgi:hypothetical protein
MGWEGRRRLRERRGGGDIGLEEGREGGREGGSVGVGNGRKGRKEGVGEKGEKAPGGA